MISADIKTDVSQQEMKELVVSFNFHRSAFSKLEIQVKQACVFHLILDDIPSRLILTIKNTGVECFY